MCCVITRARLWDTAHLNELLLLFLKIIHPFIPTPLAHIKNDFPSKFNSSKGEGEEGWVPCARGEPVKQSETNKVGRFTGTKWPMGGGINAPWEFLGSARTDVLCSVQIIPLPQAGASTVAMQKSCGEILNRFPQNYSCKKKAKIIFTWHLRDIVHLLPVSLQLPHCASSLALWQARLCEVSLFISLLLLWSCPECRISVPPQHTHTRTLSSRPWI